MKNVKITILYHYYYTEHKSVISIKTHISSQALLKASHHGLELSSLVTWTFGSFCSNSIYVPGPASEHHLFTISSNSAWSTVTASRTSNTTTNSGGTTFDWTPPYKMKIRFRSPIIVVPPLNTVSWSHVYFWIPCLPLKEQLTLYETFHTWSGVNVVVKFLIVAFWAML